MYDNYLEEIVGKCEAHDDGDDEELFDSVIEGTRVTVYHRDDNDTWYAYYGIHRTNNYRHLYQMMKEINKATGINADTLEEIEVDIDYEYDRRKEGRRCSA